MDPKLTPGDPLNSGLAAHQLPLRDRCFMPQPSSEFYPRLVQRILPCCGNEYPVSDFHSAMHTLNAQLHLGLNDRMEKVLGLMLTGLSNANRFGGSLWIKHRLGENSAVHCCHTAILVNEMFRRAGLLTPEAQAEPRVIEMRVKATIAAILHDMGEMLGEINTVDQRSHAPGMDEGETQQRVIFESVLRLAFQAVQEDQPELFYGRLQNIRNELRSRKAGPSSMGDLQEVLAKHGSTFPEGLSQVGSNQEARNEIGQLLHYFDLAENSAVDGRSAQERFIGKFTKAVEHMQGTRHLTRFCEKDASYQRLALFSPGSSRSSDTQSAEGLSDPRDRLVLPLSLSDSARIVGSLKYTEGEIGDLFALAGETGGKAEKALARTVRDSQYHTIIEYLNVSAPYFDRSGQNVVRELAEVPRRFKDPQMSLEDKLRDIEELRKKLERKQHELAAFFDTQADTGWLGSVARRQEVMSVYYEAVRMGYEPAPGEILALRQDAPEALRRFKMVDWSKHFG